MAIGPAADQVASGETGSTDSGSEDSSALPLVGAALGGAMALIAAGVVYDRRRKA